jgi:hypothetical protein
MWYYKIQTFLKALFWHIYSGSPKCSQSQIDERFNICINCSSYNTELMQCLECGCNINRRKIFLNKLAWADQHCPLNKWNKI